MQRCTKIDVQKQSSNSIKQKETILNTNDDINESSNDNIKSTYDNIINKESSRNGMNIM